MTIWINRKVKVTNAELNLYLSESLEDTRNNPHVGHVHINHLLALLTGMNCSVFL